jgi:cyclic pyranopterin phosphate synthase
LTPRKDKLSFDEVSGLLAIAGEYGLDQIKYSGGEPTLYDGLGRLIRKNKQDGVKNVSVTTNGILLEDRAEELVKAGVDEINITLDTLDPRIYKSLCGGSEAQLKKVLRGIRRLHEMGYQGFNINCVMTPKNIADIPILERFASTYGQKLRLITFVEVSGTPESRGLQAGSDIEGWIKDLRKTSEFWGVAKDASGKVMAREHRTKGTASLEIVHSCTDCDVCGRSYALRLTSDGKLKPCLTYEVAEIDVISPFRGGDMGEVRFRFEQAIALKKYGLIKYFFTPKRTKFRKLLSEES